jgi:hypothetical protein
VPAVPLGFPEPEEQPVAISAAPANVRSNIGVVKRWFNKMTASRGGGSGLARAALPGSETVSRVAPECQPTVHSPDALCTYWAGALESNPAGALAFRIT